MNEIIQALLSVKGINRKLIYRLHNEKINFLDTDNLIYKLNNMISKKYDSVDKKTLKEKILKAQEIINIAESKNIKVLSFLDHNFPDRLKNIIDPPVLLYIKGDLLPFNDGINIAIIGTREPTKHGIEITKRLSRIFTEKGCNIISGLANGCDKFAHEECIKIKGKTLAVLPSGINNVFPKANLSLSEKIITTNGVLMSEYDINHKPFKAEYIERDRLQSGLSEIVVIVETDTTGGSMHTARFSIEQNKILSAYNPSLKYDVKSKTKGNKLLIKEKKALPIEKIEDIEALIEKAKELKLKSEKYNEETKIENKKVTQLRLINSIL